MTCKNCVYFTIGTEDPHLNFIHDNTATKKEHPFCVMKPLFTEADPKDDVCPDFCYDNSDDSFELSEMFGEENAENDE